MSYISEPSFEGSFDRYIFKKNDNKFIKELRNDISNCLNIKKLEELHLQVESEKINELRIKAFKSINKISEWKKKILDLISPEIYEILGLDLAIQKNLNLSIQMPGEVNSILEKHVDYRTGDSPFQRVVWIPVTNSYDSNSIFMLDKESNYKPININYGEFLVFDPNTEHGNIVNKTDKTRVSINVRVKNWFSPDLSNFAPDRQFGVYYEDLCFSESTIRAFEILDKENE
ncbi:sporadic carbohydrate cluster 2OG-Fe(II) oxygenase [Prochlorococcus marinus]|uniref:2OG-Fe(II) dioxygenase superfamily protein n=1 Tax=Prochlorococcus marinus (strain AS9601) TaxID=146891 RepID=A2BSG9_PROMS|nr:sporadic carbohydrate cluster 2OG-Fe(II) oxygenase [Prochlorococcus marinus]ABM70730.1 2OG-Fe(II) dioxygenase superfamily protein [Prochlorococcus marinus str. AS9601]